MGFGMLFYKLRLLSYIFGSFKNTTLRLLLCMIYLYAVSIVLIFLSDGFQYAMEASSPIRAFHELYKYIKMCYANRGNLGYGIPIRTLLALLIPNLFYKIFVGTNWRRLFKKAVIKCTKVVWRREDKKFYNSDCNIVYNSGHDYDEKLVNIVKELLMHDIEQTIDKRLHEVFRTRRHDKDFKE